MTINVFETNEPINKEAGNNEIKSEIKKTLISFLYNFSFIDN